MWVKVCGCRTAEGVDAAVAAGADAIGLIFAESRRRVTPEAARILRRRVPSSVAVVGVVRSPTPARLRELLGTVSLDMLQLSGRMPMGLAEELRVLRTIYLGQGDRLPPGSLPRAYALHLDRRMGQRFGGTGERVSTGAARRLSQMGHRIVLAGGLTPENVSLAITEAQPFGVDVASGVESAGEQDPERILRFVLAAKGVGAQ